MCVWRGPQRLGVYVWGGGFHREKGATGRECLGVGAPSDLTRGDEATGRWRCVGEGARKD